MSWVYAMMATSTYLQREEPLVQCHMTRCQPAQRDIPVQQTPQGQCRAESHTSCSACALYQGDGTQWTDQSLRPSDDLWMVNTIIMTVVEVHHIHYQDTLTISIQQDVLRFDVSMSNTTTV